MDVINLKRFPRSTMKRDLANVDLKHYRILVLAPTRQDTKVTATATKQTLHGHDYSSYMLGRTVSSVVPRLLFAPVPQAELHYSMKALTSRIKKYSCDWQLAR